MATRTVNLSMVALLAAVVTFVIAALGVHVDSVSTLRETDIGLAFLALAGLV